jgi:hypothetical protein
VRPANSTCLATVLIPGPWRRRPADQGTLTISVAVPLRAFLLWRIVKAEPRGLAWCRRHDRGVVVRVGIERLRPARAWPGRTSSRRSLDVSARRLLAPVTKVWRVVRGGLRSFPRSCGAAGVRPGRVPDLPPDMPPTTPQTPKGLAAALTPQLTRYITSRPPSSTPVRCRPDARCSIALGTECDSEVHAALAPRLDDEQQPWLGALLLDGCECAQRPDRVLRDASLSLIARAR